MEKKIKPILLVYVFIFIFLSLTLVACGKVDTPPVKPPVLEDCTEHVDSDLNEICDNCGEDLSVEIKPDPVGVEFKVSLIYNKKVYVPSDGEEITVVWSDDYSRYTEKLNSEGYAIKTLDGDFNVYLSNLPEGYTYNPNIYTADNENSVTQIELIKIAKISRGKGTALYNEFLVSTTGAFRATLKTQDQKVYYQYQPTKSGYYIIESLVNTYEDVINPKIDTYTGTFAAKYFSETIDGGGASHKGGYTKNFRWVIRLTDDMINNVFTFAVFADSKSGTYPVIVDFRIEYAGTYYIDPIVSSLIMAEEANFMMPEYSSSDYVFINSDGGTGSYYAGATNGTGLMDGKNFKYNEETGYWHVYNPQTDTFGPILCAKITAPCAYYEESLNMIQSHGNKNLTVSDGTENYTQFIEVQYAAICNSDGVCYVTMELKEFLQKFSISQRLFMDGGGFVESTGVYAIEEDQWLFACGYYKEK